MAVHGYAVPDPLHLKLTQFKPERFSAMMTLTI